MSLTGLKSRCQQSCFPFWRLWEKVLSSPLPALRGYLHFLAYGPFLRLQRQQNYISLTFFQSHTSHRLALAGKRSLLFRILMIRLALLE